MRSVEKSDLSFMVWSFARNEKNIKASLVCREFRSDRFRSLDNPKMEYFSLYNQIVLIADALMDLPDGILRIAGDYTVDQCTVYAARLLEPCLETFPEVPQLDILINTFLELLSVKEDQFARKYDEAFSHVTVEVLISAVKKLSELSRI